ncbi:MAG: hypothetical protein Q8P91_03000, partial [bacterium]|nr:hypothetical protein [bacterium]
PSLIIEKVCWVCLPGIIITSTIGGEMEREMASWACAVAGAKTDNTASIDIIINFAGKIKNFIISSLVLP